MKTTAAPSRSGFQPRGSDQLPRPQQEEDRNIGRGLLALLALLLLVVGVPTLLVLFVGNPLPSELPDRSWLDADITAAAIIDIMAALCWVVWAHFMVCLATEARSLRAGRLPHLVPLGGGTQLVARRLIAGVLLLAGSATMTGNAPTQAGDAPETVVSANAATADTSGPSDARSVGATRVDAEGSDRLVQGLRDATQERAEQVVQRADLPVVHYYEVKPPQGRNYDTLWDIADRTLGDPFRYKELYELNRDRAQPDGRKLVDADLIQPGWQLVMPADATGPDIQTVRARTAVPSTSAGPAEGATTETAPEASAPEASAPEASAPGAADDGRSSVLVGASVDTEVDGGVDLGDLGLGGGLVLAGVLLAMSTRRGPYGTPGREEQSLRLAANPGRADLLDRATRLLAEGRRQQQQPLPDVVAAYVGDEQVIVHLAGSASSAAPPPPPWRPAEDGTAWVLHATDIDGQSSSAAAPWPTLVNIAESHGFDLMVDLEYAPGLISIGGAPEISREVALSTVVDLVTHPWSDGVEVTMVGFGGDLTDVAPGRIRHVSTIEDALEHAQAATARSQGLVRALGVDGVLAGRAAGRRHGHDLRPHVLVLSGSPSPEQAQQLAEIFSQGRSVLSVLCIGSTLAARWRFTTDSAGSIDLGALGFSGTARRLTIGGMDQVRGLLRQVSEESAERTREAAVLSPADAAVEVPGPSHHGQDVLSREHALAEVTLLGPVAVTASGEVASSRETLLTELVTLVALHPQGVHESVLRVSLWPRGVGDDVLEATAAAAVRWLGATAAGEDLLHQDEQGRWRLRSEVFIDWMSLASVARDRQDEPHVVTAALALGRGVAFSGTPAGRYAWLAFHQAARDARVVVTAAARRSATQHLAAERVQEADRSLRLGLALVPQAQPLWRDLLRLWGDRDPDAVGSVVDQLHQHVEPAGYEPETSALVQHLAPEHSQTS